MQSHSSQPSARLAPSVLIDRFIQTSTLLFKRRMPDDELDALGVESAMPGLEVSDADWETWVGAAGSLR
ncbi:hypothetical protein [Paucibacter soli]|uniref:hypothetical protein n=1 Tax=Paucibacter soli TaxID=3133433 RepID=UPI003098C527